MSHRNSRLTVLLVAALLMLVVAGSAVAQKPTTLVRDSIPDKYKWDFSQIYPNWDAWQADYDRIDSMMQQYVGLKGTLSQGPDALLKAFTMSDSLGILQYKVYRYPALQSAVDSRDNEIKARLQKVQILFARFGQETAWFNPELLEIPWDTVNQWLGSTAALGPYRHGVEDLYRQQAHVLSADKEQLLSYFSRVYGAPANIFGELTVTDMDYPEVTLSDGVEVTLTPGTYQSILTTNRNQDDRAKVFEGFYGAYAANKNSYAAMYDGVLQVDWASTQARSYESCLQSYLDGDNVSTSVYETLVNTVRNGCEPMRRYYRLRKEKLGLASFHLYDGNLPLVQFDKKYDYDVIQNWIVEAMKPLGQDYQKRLTTAFNERWIDVYENEGKTTGAFSANVYGVHPYMLLNYNETLREVFTVAHELGHCMHSILSNENQPFATSGYSIFVAEVPSTLNEALLLEYMMDKTKDPLERAALLTRAIDNILGTFYTQTMWADFELQTHKMVEQGQPVTAESLAQLYSGIVDTYEGGAVEIDSLYRYTWTRLPPFYGTPFYVYKYATCYASSAKLVKEMKSKDKKVRQAALDRYMTLLKSGGSDYPMDLLIKAGADLSQPETVQAVVDHLDDLVTRLEQELAKL